MEECFLTVFEEINAIRPLKIDHGGVWSNERDPIGKQVGMVDNLNLKAPTIICSRRQFQILLLFQK